MSLRIEDGKGRGKYASVDHDNRLEVAAITLPLITSQAHEGRAFALLGRHTIESTGATENVAFIQNSNTNAHVHMQTLTYAVNATAEILLNVGFEASRTSGGTAITAVQLFRGSAREAGIVAHDNSSDDLVCGIASLEDFSEIRMASISTAHFESTGVVILGPGDTLLIRAKGTVGDQVTVGSFLYEYEENS